MRLLCMIIFGKCSMPKIGKEYLGKINVLTIKRCSADQPLETHFRKDFKTL